jgi:glutaredoxin
MAKDYLAEHGLGYFEHLYDDDDARREMYDRLGLEGGERTVPQIFVAQTGCSERIGGYDDLVRSDLMSRASMGEFDVEF